MTITTIKDELTKAQQGQYAVPLFDVFEMQGMEGVLEALCEKRAPTIIGVYGPFAARPNCRALAAYIRTRATDTDIPISLMLDHGGSVEQCLEVLEYGFTDVMYDGSILPFEQNIANTRRVVEAAHARGVGVEAELGHVGMGDQYDALGAKRIGFTDAEHVAEFVRATGVDYLAIAFGTAHGVYNDKPRLDLELVAEIRRRVAVPLVMHGGTGLSEEQFRGAIVAGISKINFATSIMNSAAENMREAAEKKNASMFEIQAGIKAAYQQWCAGLYETFGTARRV